MTIIEKIHNEFDMAQEELLKEAKEVLNKLELSSLDKLRDKANRLKSLGFTSTREVKVVGEKQNIEKINKEMAEIISYYKNNYPFLKFLTEDKLDEICKKYNLIYAPVSNYIGEVPIKNLEDIEKAQILKSNDISSNEYFYEFSDIQEKKTKRYIGKTVFTREEIIDIYLKSFDDNKHYVAYHIRNNNLREEYFNEFPWYIGLSEKCPSSLSNCTVTTINKKGLFIAAPEKDFDLKGLSKNKLGFLNIFKQELKDPIVFRYVRGGIQILTKWGDEASDPDLQNIIDN